MKELKTPRVLIRIHAYWRAVAVISALLSVGALLLGYAESRSPHLVFQSDEAGVHSLSVPAWRKASAWLGGSKYIVLTFDDGPYGHGVDERILSTLRRHHAHAVFFLVCNHLDDGKEKVLNEITQEGSLIGNHSYDHSRLITLGPDELRHQIEGCSTRIFELSGHRPSYFRPPFGETSPRVAQMIKMSGMSQILWDANSQDSWLTKPEQIHHFSLEQTENGSILLMHSRPTTEDVLDRVMTDLEDRGFHFVLPDEMPLADQAG